MTSALAEVVVRPRIAIATAARVNTVPNGFFFVTWVALKSLRMRFDHVPVLRSRQHCSVKPMGLRPDDCCRPSVHAPATLGNLPEQHNLYRSRDQGHYGMTTVLLAPPQKKNPFRQPGEHPAGDRGKRPTTRAEPAHLRPATAQSRPTATVRHGGPGRSSLRRHLVCRP